MHFFHRTLSPSEITIATAYKSSSPDKSKYDYPEFRSEFNLGRTYTPSYNIAPTDISPVLISAAHFEDTCPSDERILVPMMWSMIPYWHKGDYRKHGLTTNNCRLETMTTSKLYKHALERGQRCVIVCEGFYEWQTTNPEAKKSSERDAYYFYMPQKDSVKIAHKNTWTPEDIQLLYVAGLFDIWTDDNGDDIFSYTVITFESNEEFSWLHHRSPAVLENDQQIADWLDYKRVSTNDAIKIIQPAKTLVWHRVSKNVNNSRNKSEQCNKPIEEVTEKRSASTSGLSKWLQKKSKLE